MFLHGTCCLHLPYPNPGFTTGQRPVSGHAPLFPLAALWGFSSLQQPPLNCCLSVCVDGNVSGLLFLPFTFLVLGSCRLLFFLFLENWQCTDFVIFSCPASVLWRLNLLLTSPWETDQPIKQKSHSINDELETKTIEHQTEGRSCRNPAALFHMYTPYRLDVLFTSRKFIWWEQKSFRSNNFFQFISICTQNIDHIWYIISLHSPTG